MLQTRRLWGIGPLLAITLLATSVSTAFASDVYGSKAYYGPIGGWSYWNQNSLFNEGNSGSWGYIEVSNQGKGNIPTGYFGGDARVYKEGGSLCLQGGWQYNTEYAAAEAFWSGTGIASKCGSGNYYSNGQSRAWTGSAYNTYSSYNTPYLYI